MRKMRNTLRSEKTANDEYKQIMEEGEAERDLQPTRDMEKARDESWASVLKAFSRDNVPFIILRRGKELSRSARPSRTCAMMMSVACRPAASLKMMWNICA